MSRPSSPSTAFAREHSIPIRRVRRLGIDRLLAMSSEARALMLSNTSCGMSSYELHKGGLSARGFKVRGKSA